MQKKLSKAKQKLRERFAKYVVEVIERHGGTPLDIEHGEWTLPTKYGPLRLHVIPDFGDIGAVMTVFDNAELAAPHTGCNPYSGKWNHHYFTWDLQTASDDFAWQIKSVAVVKGEVEERLIAACKAWLDWETCSPSDGEIATKFNRAVVLSRAAVAQAEGVAA